MKNPLSSALLCLADLEKAASGASGASSACRHFVKNLAILRTFWVKYPIHLSEDGERKVEDGELMLVKGDLRLEDGK